MKTYRRLILLVVAIVSSISISACSLFPEHDNSPVNNQSSDKENGNDEGDFHYGDDEEPTPEAPDTPITPDEPVTPDDPETPVNPEPIEEPYVMESLKFNGINVENNLSKFIKQVDIDENIHNNNAIDHSLIISPYYTSTDLDIYASLTANGVHSFAYVITNKDPESEITLNYIENINNVELLTPNVTTPTYKAENKSLKVSLKSFGTYTFILNKDLNKPITLYVEKDEEYVEGKAKVRTFEPGTYNEPIIAQEGQLLYFKKGVYNILKIQLANNSEIRFEDGTFITAINPSKANETPILDPDWADMTRFPAFINANYVNNLKISGRAIIDLGKLAWHARLGLFFEHCNNISCKDFMLVNSPEWTFELACCVSGTVNQVKLFGYRQNSDGFAIVDSQGITIRNCFARCGDDLFEVKSMYGADTIEIKNIRFEYNTAWPDKCRGYGIIHETQRNITDVKFSNCIVCAAPATWMDALGALVVIMANNSTCSDITFTNIKINHNEFYPINVTMHEESSGTIKNITFHNINYQNSNKIRILNSSSSGKIDGVYLTNIYRQGIRQSSGVIYKEGSNITNVKMS